MSFLVTARKFRPKSFSEVVAQKHVINTLLNAVKMHRIAHAYLFCGPRGVGKTTVARIFAKAINCPNAIDGEPCNTCSTCVEISEGRSIDVIEIDGASNNGVEQVRNIRESVRYVPSREKYKMYIIDEVHMLTTAAFNALLKTLEEPPPHALFVFATTEVHKLPATVVSRCQRYDFRRMGIEDIMQQLRYISHEEHFSIDDEALLIIAKKADGSMRDAQSIFDQVVAFTGSEITGAYVRDVLHVVDQEFYFRITDLIKSKDTKGGFAIAEEIIMSGFDAQEFLAGLEEHFRNLLLAKTTGEARLIEASEIHKQRYMTEAATFAEGDMLRFLNLTAEAMQSIKYSTQPRLKFEIALIRMIKMDSTVAIGDLIAQLDALKKSNSGGSGTVTTLSQPPVKQQYSGGYKSISSAPMYQPTPTMNVKSSMNAIPDVKSDGITIDTVSQQWSKFVESVRTFRRTLGLNLEQSQPVQLESGVLQVVCDSDFHYNQLHSSTVVLRERFEQFFGQGINYEFYVGQPQPLAKTPDRAQEIFTSSASEPPPPLIQLLIDELGAELIR